MSAEEEVLDSKAFATNPFWNGFFEGLRPDPILTVTEWADEHRVISSKGGAEPGKWRTSRTPYLKEIMDCLSPTAPQTEIVFMKGAQVGGTEAGNNWIGFIIAQAPAPTMVVQPSIDVAKKFSKQRIAPMIEEMPVLKARVKDAKSRDSGNTTLLKEFTGGLLLMAGANAASGLRSIPIKNLMLDEIDAYDQDVEGEGSPIKLATARTRTFSGKKKIFKISTPTLEGTSAIAPAFEASDKRFYHVPCPQCGQYQKLKFANLKWEEGHPETVYYVCEINACEIKEHHKTKMLAAGKWIAENPGAGLGKIAGFHLSSLYSPLGWLSWIEIAQDWIEATKSGSQELLRTFVNTHLGETWKEKGEAPEWRRLYERRETYSTNSIDPGIYFITCGVDVQGDRLEAQLVGWGRERESWVIDNRIFLGNTEDLGPNGPWRGVEKMLREQWKTKTGQSISIRLMAIDSGFRTQTVYDFVRRFPGTRVIATKGFDKMSATIGHPSVVDVTIGGKKLRRGMRVWPVGSSHGKSELYGVLRLDRPTDEELADGAGFPPGFVHFPELGEEYFRQLCAEELQTKIHKGFRRYEWVKKYERNEALDTFVLNRAAAAAVGIDRFTDENWEAVLMDLGPILRRGEAAPPEEEDAPENTVVPSVVPTPSQPAPQTQGVIPRRKSKFL